MSRKEKPAQVVEITKAAEKADSRKQAKREAKARELQQRFSSARRGAESKSKAADRLKKLFKNPPKSPSR